MEGRQIGRRAEDANGIAVTARDASRFDGTSRHGAVKYANRASLVDRATGPAPSEKSLALLALQEPICDCDRSNVTVSARVESTVREIRSRGFKAPRGGWLLS